jgi:hypothetical protein
MSSRPLTSDDLATNEATPDGPGESKYQISSYKNPSDYNITTGEAYTTPIKMLGIIMSVRTKKIVDRNTGAVTMSYTISGFDFGYFMHSSIYVNSYLEQDYRNNNFNSVISGIAYPASAIGLNDPVKNLNLVLEMWSSVTSSGLPGLSGEQSVFPPKIGIVVPPDLVDMFGMDGNQILDLMTKFIGLDKRTNKAGDEGDFRSPLPGQKMLHMQTLITNSTLWNLLQSYLNPVLNEAYCDLHIVKTGFSYYVEPTLVARQMPFNTPDYKDVYTRGATGTVNEVTLLIDLPKTEIPAVNLLDYDIGYSEYERVDFIELNGFSNQGLAAGKTESSSFYMANFPVSEENAIKRFGLKPKVHHGIDYGIDQSGRDSSAMWMPIVADYWFNANMYMNGTIQCIGFDRHIAVGENISLPSEEIIGHIEAYTHTVDVNHETGVKIFRTTIEFSKGISSRSTKNKYIYMCDDPKFPDEFGAEMSGDPDVKTSVLSDEVANTVTFTPRTTVIKKEIE